MKKHFILLAIILILSGCSTAENAQNQKGEDINKKDKQEKTMETTKQPENNIVDNSTFENLVSTYSLAIMKTNYGDIKIKFYNEESPETVNNFLNLAKIGFFNGIRFHRVIKDFMIQGGDPNSKSDNWMTHGTGGPGYKFADEFNSKPLVRGSLAMANSGPNTNGSQFFIVTAQATPWLDGKHTNFGEIVDGMDIVDKIENVETNERDHPITDVVINSIELE